MYGVLNECVVVMCEVFKLFGFVGVVFELLVVFVVCIGSVGCVKVYVDMKYDVFVFVVCIGWLFDVYLIGCVCYCVLLYFVMYMFVVVVFVYYDFYWCDVIMGFGVLFVCYLMID